MSTPSDNEIIQSAINLVNEGLRVTFPVKGYSMLPFIIGSKESVDLVKPENLQVGHVVLAWVEGCRYVVHRIIAIHGDQVVLMGDGNISGTESCRVSDVAGVVTQYLRPRRMMFASDPKLQRRIRLWRKLLPVRRYLLFIYKAII